MSEETKKQIKKYIKKDLFFFGALFLYILLTYFLFKANCPIRFFLKFPCPFCGMTRAHLAALRFDFKSAFDYHPLFFLGVPYLFLLTHDELFNKKWKLPYQITVGITTGLFILCYIIRYIIPLFDK